MNHGHPYIGSAQHMQMSAGPPYVPHSQAAGMSHYPQYHPQTTNTYHPGVSSYGYQYGGTTSSYSAGQPASVTSSLLPFPLGTSATGQHGYHTHPQYTSGGHQPVSTFDTSGQVQPANKSKPRMTATLWEDEGTLCFQVEAKGVTVARRDDNGYVNGTKLLNVCGMTRGRRDGILKSEKNRNVVKIGPMHLKGVWIPYEKALEFANKEKITDLLYPLFVHNASAMMSTHNGQHGDHARNLESTRGRPRARDTPIGSILSQVPSQIGSNPSSAIGQPATERPVMGRALTFPTPPTSASSLIAGQTNSYDWNHQQNMATNVQSSQPLAIDTSLSNSRSLPNTPASTPPGSTIQPMPTYQNNQYPIQQGNARYGSSNAFIKSEMGPPLKSTTGEPDQIEIKQDPFVHNNAETADTSEGDSFVRGNNYMNYNGMVDNSIPPPDQANGSPHQSRRGTPRSSIHSQQWSNGYNTPNRNGATYTDPPVSTSYSGPNYTPTSLGGVKRGREDDDCDYKPPRSNISEDMDSVKRRRGTTDSSISSISAYDSNRLQNGNSIVSRIR